MVPNLLTLALAAAIPLVIGFIWYNPKTLGTAWMHTAGLTEEKLQGGNMALIFGLTYVLSFFIAASLFQVVIHQSAFFSILVGEPGLGEEGSELMAYVNDFMAKYGDNYRTFKHGAFHGVFTGLLFATPLIGINAMFERRSFKYVAIHAGYWIITIALMGGVICQWG